MEAKNLEQAGGTRFGTGDEPTGKPFRAGVFIDGERYRMLDRRQAYYDCTQHDYKTFDFDGRYIGQQAGIAFTQPFLGQTTAQKAAWYVPLKSRRPSAPYRLTRAVVNAFTNFVLGEGRFPNLRVPGDADSEDFVQTIGRVGQLPLRMMRARSIGGAVGTVGLSWAFVDGKPRFQVHNGKHLFVHEWEDREALIPAYVTECFQFGQEEYNPEKKVVEKVLYWHRRDWTKKADVVFLPAKVEEDKQREPQWVPDVDRSVVHRDGDTHFVWVQNLPSEDVDGVPDCDGLWESLDELDCVLSVIVRGAKLNLDPTLVIKEDKLFVQMRGIKKGSDNALVIDKDGDAKYLELAGTSIEAGIKLFNEHRRTILEVAECVIPDSDQIAAQGQSSAAQKMVFSRMLSKGGALQEQYGTALQRLMEPVLWIAQARVQVPVTLVDEQGNEQQADQSFKLPKKVNQKPVVGDDGAPTGEQEPELVDRQPGAGTDIELEWPPRFPPTSLDQQQMVTTLSAAVGGKPILSQQTAVELTVAQFGREGADEWARVQQMGKEDDAKQAAQADAMSGGGAGGKQPNAMAHQPPGAKPPGGGGGKPPGGGGGGGGGDSKEPDAPPPED
jgi:hypothetical protein